MKSFCLLTSLLIACAAGAASPIDGHYRLVGVSCEIETALTARARDTNEALASGNLQVIGSFAGDKATFKSRKFRWLNYGHDACVVTNVSKVVVENDIATMVHTRQTADAVTTDDVQLCRAENGKALPEKFKFRAEGLVVYFSNVQRGEMDEAHCKSGVAIRRFERLPRFEFPSVRRPEKGAKELALLEAVKKNPKSVNPLITYALFLVREDRITETEPVIQEIRKLEPKNADAETFAVLVRAYRASPDAFQRLTLREDAIEEVMARIQAQNEVQKLSRAIASIQSPEPKFKLTPEEARRRELNEKFSIEKSAASQYEPKPEEQKAFDEALDRGQGDRKGNLAQVEPLLKKFPGSPYIFQQYLLLLVEDYQVNTARWLWNENAAKFSGQVGLQIIGMHLNGSGAEAPELLKRIDEDLEYFYQILIIADVKRMAGRQPARERR